MNTILIQGDWNILKGKVKQTLGMLTGDRLEYREGRTEECLGRLQKKTGEQRAAIERSMRECEKLRKQIDQALKWFSCTDAHDKRSGVSAKETCSCV